MNNLRSPFNAFSQLWIINTEFKMILNPNKKKKTSAPIGVIMTCACDWADIQPEFAVQDPMLLHLPPPQKRT